MLEVEHSASQETIAIVQGAWSGRQDGGKCTLSGIDIAEHSYSQVIRRGGDHDGLFIRLALLLWYSCSLLGDLRVFLLFDLLRSGVRC